MAFLRSVLFASLVTLCSLQGTIAGYGDAFTVYSPFSVNDFQCIYRYYSQAVPTIRVYAGGRNDPNGLQNLQNAGQAGFNSREVYVQPDALNSKSATKQFDEAYQYLKSGKYNVQTMWLTVTNPLSWSSRLSNNVNFINEFVRRGKQNGVTIGIYTSWYDWLLITDDNRGVNAPLWYWHTLGRGSGAKTYKDMSDFRAFGSWQSASPNLKEYDVVDGSICGKYLSWSIFTTNRAMVVGKNENNMTLKKLLNPKQENAEMIGGTFLQQ